MELRRHEVNGNLSVVDDERDVLGGLRAMVLGSEIFWSLDGKYKLVAPDTSRSEADQVVYTITDEHLVPGTFQDIPPEASEVVNKVVATFANTDKDLAEDSVTFPATGSDLETRLQREDGRGDIAAHRPSLRRQPLRRQSHSRQPSFDEQAGSFTSSRE